MSVTPEELLAGSQLEHDVVVPTEVLRPSMNGDPSDADAAESTKPQHVRLRPLTVRDAHLIAKAAKDDEVLTSILMIERALIEPKLAREQISKLHGGLVRFLVTAINRISGLSTTEDDLAQIADAPLVQAFFVLAREFHWTPQQIREMTMGEILPYLEQLVRQKRGN